MATENPVIVFNVMIRDLDIERRSTACPILRERQRAVFLPKAQASNECRSSRHSVLDGPLWQMQQAIRASSEQGASLSAMRDIRLHSGECWR